MQSHMNSDCKIITVIKIYNTFTKYHIAGKFGGENVWWIYSFQALGGKKFGEWIDSPKGYE